MRTLFPFCACGCGVRVLTAAARFLPGHNIRNRQWTPEQKRKVAETMKRVMTPAMREARRISGTGRTHTPESIARMRAAAITREADKRRLGWKPSEETRTKLSQALKGRVFSPATRALLSAARKGRPVTPQQRADIAETLREYYQHKENPFKGHHHSAESIAKMSKALKGVYIREQGSNWRGGINAFPYAPGWDSTLRTQIKHRDNHRCCNPECSGRVSVLDVHHINYDKTDNSPDNLITLCKECHGQTQFRRRYWTRYYQRIQLERNDDEIRGHVQDQTQSPGYPRGTLPAGAAETAGAPGTSGPAGRTNGVSRGGTP